MKILLIFIISLSISISIWNCNDNSVSNNIIFQRDSLFVSMLDTTVLPYFDPQPYSIGNLSGKLTLEFDSETNLDSTNGIPFFAVDLYPEGSLNKNRILFVSYSKTEINGHHSFTIDLHFQQCYYSLYIDLKILNPHNYGVFKYVSITNLKLLQS